MGVSQKVGVAANIAIIVTCVVLLAFVVIVARERAAIPFFRPRISLATSSRRSRLLLGVVRRLSSYFARVAGRAVTAPTSTALWPTELGSRVESA